MMDTDDKDKTNINFRTFFSYDSRRQRHVHYLLQTDDTLFIVARKSLEERSELVLKHRYEHVIDYRVEDESNTGHPVVTIYNLDGSQISSNFIDLLPSGPPAEMDPQAALLTHQLHMQRELNQQLLQDIGRRLKFGTTSDDNPTNECLVRYGDPWRRIHNDQLIIGVPVLNAGTG